MTLSQSLLQLAAQMAPAVQTWPRRQPGLLMVDGKALRYADLHSLYHQIRQIYGELLYDFRSPNTAPHILDCGAHVGVASLFFKERYPGARITAFEADGALADICRANFKTFGMADIAVVDAAVWIHDDGVNFNQSHDDSGHVTEGDDSSHVTEGSAIGTTKSVRLKRLLAEGPVDLLKLDVEGAEFAIIKDCGEELAGVKRLVAEVHAMDGAPPRIGALLAELEQRGFRYVLGDLHQATWLPPAPTPYPYCRTAKFIVTVYAWRD